LARKNRTTFAHHGTTEELAQEIIKTGFKQSEEKWDWLGYGIYFWEDSPARALLWARQKHSNGSLSVIDAEIALEHCLNLLDPEGAAKLKRFYRRYILATGVEVASLKSTAGNHELDCRVINYACEQWAEFGYHVHVIRGGFVEGDPLYSHGLGGPDSKIHDLSHVQLAVRDTCAILNVEIAEVE
jgi:hypothetical protein